VRLPRQLAGLSFSVPGESRANQLVMGAKATKEYAPTARQVLSRRAIDKNLKQSFGERAPSGVTEVNKVNESTEFQEVPGEQTIASVNKTAPLKPTEVIVEAPMKPEILKEMSSWSMVTSEDDKHHLKLRHETGKDMASVIRFKEEAEIREKFGKTPTKMTGSLTEGQLFDVLKGVRDKPKTFSAQKISEDFEISVEAAAAIIKCARFPKLETSTESIEMFIAK
jgi:hypothetical protein